MNPLLIVWPIKNTLDLTGSINVPSVSMGTHGRPGGMLELVLMTLIMIDVFLAKMIITVWLIRKWLSMEPIVLCVKMDLLLIRTECARNSGLPCAMKMLHFLFKIGKI